MSTRNSPAIVIDKMSRRKAEMQDMRPSGGGKLRLSFLAPTRGLIGYHGEFLTDTRGSGVMSRLFHGYAPYKGPVEGRRNGVLISTAQGAAVAYALWNLEERGPMFITPGADVYAGMIVGAHSRGNDLDVNPLKGKQLTNIRTTSKDEAVRLTPPHADEPGRGDRLYRRRRAGRGDAEGDPPAQAAPRHQRPQARDPRRRGGIAAGDAHAPRAPSRSSRTPRGRASPSHHSCQTPQPADRTAQRCGEAAARCRRDRVRGHGAAPSRSHNQPSSSANSTAPGNPSSSQTCNAASCGCSGSRFCPGRIRSLPPGIARDASRPQPSSGRSAMRSPAKDQISSRCPAES